MPAGFLAEITTKATLVLLAAWAMTAIMAARSSASRRHLVWAVALAGALCIPFIVIAGPRWHLATWPGGYGRGRPGAAPVSDPAGRSAGAAVVPAHDLRVAASDSDRGPIDPDGLFGNGRVPAGVAQARWPMMVTLLWAAGMVAGMIRLIAGLVWAGWIARRARRLTDPAWDTALAAASSVLGLRRAIPLLISDGTAVPVTCGVLRPKLLFPRDADTWEPSRRHVVLLHELAHVKRRDCLVQALAQMTCAIHWFNPVAILAASRLRAEQERACDDLVLGAGHSGPAYAHHLCDIAGAARPVAFPGWVTLAMAGSSRFEHRVRAILNERHDRRPASGRLAIGCALIGAAAVVPLGALRSPATAAVSTPLAPLPAVALTEPVRPPSVVAPLLRAAMAPELESRVAGAATAATVQNADGNRAFLDAYCTTCHGPDLRAAGVALDRIDVQNLAANADLWEKALRKLRAGTHPPVPATTAAGRLMPDKGAINAFITALEAGLDESDRWGPGDAAALSGNELAARISRFFWNADPDAELEDLAARGSLFDPGVLRAQTRRLLADGRATALLTRFFGQWLYLDNIAKVKPEPARYPDFDDSLREAFRKETELFIDSQVREDRAVTELLTANYTFLNDRLARHYGIPGISGPEFRRVTLRDDNRAGLLGQGSILTVTSYANRTSPVLRGKFVLETFLGTPPPPPPRNVPALKEDADGVSTSGRSRLEEHTKNAVCMSCHVVINPMGFALENFDAVGQWRDAEGSTPVDASGAFPDGTSFNGPVEFRIGLLQRHDALVTTIAERLLAYAIGRGLQSYDMPAVRTIARDAQADNNRWSSLIVGVMRSAPFRMKRVPGP
jgi:beta-lactamase regulating signal transducer with metallopeptidase domain